MPAGELPSGTVTLLFSDIEGSTRLLQRLGDAYGELLADHRRLLRAAFDAHGGREIDTQGDAFFVAFPRAKEAVAAAVDAQRALAGHAWPDGVDVRVRMGLHTGEPVLGEEGYHGLGVHRGARICSAGHGGQILLSNVTRELLADERIDGIELRDLGERHLKDLDRPERIAEVVYPGMPASFPPLKTAADAPFEGREDDLAEAVASRFGWARPRLSRGWAAVAAIAVAGVVVAVVLVAGGGGHVSAKLTADALGILSPDGRQLKAAVPVGTSPSGVAVGEGAVWVTNADGGTVSRVDPRSHLVTQTIAVGNSPQGVAVAGGFVWVANGLDGTVSQIDPRTDGGKALQTIPVGNQPTALAAGRNAVWVANSVDGTITRIDAATGEAGRPVKIRSGADVLAVAADGLWVAGRQSGTVTAADPASGEALQQIPVGQGPSAVAVGAGAVWVANTLDGTVSKIDPERSRVAATVPVGGEPSGIAVSGRAVWVSDESGRIVQIDPAAARVTRIVSVDNRPSAVAAAPSGLYVALRTAGPAHRGGVLRVAATGSSVDSLDPGLAYSGMSWALLSSTNDGLVAFRRVGGASGNQLVPDLATSLPRPAGDGTAYGFRLRRGIRYSTGQPVVAGDIRHGIERIFSIKDSPGPQYFTSIVGATACLKRPRAPCDLSKGIQTSDAAGTITFRLTTPDPDLLYKLALPFAYAVPRSTPRHEVPGGVPATGPYEISRVTAKQAELVRNPHFSEWSHAAKPDGYADRIEVFRNVKPAREVVGVVRGTIDLAADTFVLGGAERQRLSTLHASQVHVTPVRATMFVFLNTTRRPFDDVRARRAVSLAVDRSAVVHNTSDGVVTCQLLPPGFVGYRRYCPDGPRPDLAAARRLVRESGTAGARVTIWSPGERRGAVIVDETARAMRSLGYHVRLRNFHSADRYFAAVQAPGADAQAGFYAWAADYPGPNGFMTPLLACKSGANLMRLCDRKIGAAIPRASRLAGTDQQAASELWARIDHRITDLAAIIPFVNLTDFQLVGTRVRNYQYHPEWSVLLDQLWVR